jgi:hypothetical protein
MFFFSRVFGVRPWEICRQNRTKVASLEFFGIEASFCAVRKDVALHDNFLNTNYFGPHDPGS